MIAAEFKIQGLEQVLDTLRRLPAEVVSKRGGPVKLALRAGARVLLKEARQNIRRVTANATILAPESTGLLAKSVVATRGKALAGGNGERYLVRVKRKVYPGRNGEQVTTLKTAQILEYGRSDQKAEPWLRPAFLAKREAAVRAIEVELKAQVDRAVAKLGKRG